MIALWVFAETPWAPSGGILPAMAALHAKCQNGITKSKGQILSLCLLCEFITFRIAGEQVQVNHSVLCNLNHIDNELRSYTDVV